MRDERPGQASREVSYPSGTVLAIPAEAGMPSGELMTKDEATALLADTLHKIAPEVDLGAIDPDLPLQEAASIDSVDFLALVTAIHDHAGIEIPVRDYPRLATLNLFVSYLVSASSSD